MVDGTGVVLALLLMCCHILTDDGGVDGTVGDVRAGVGSDSTGAGRVDGTGDRVVASDGDVKVQFHLI